VPSRNHADGFGQDILSRSKVSDNYIPASVNLHKLSLPRSVFICFLCVAHLTEIISLTIWISWPRRKIFCDI